MLRAGRFPTASSVWFLRPRRSPLGLAKSSEQFNDLCRGLDTDLSPLVSVSSRRRSQSKLYAEMSPLLALLTRRLRSLALEPSPLPWCWGS